MVMMSNTYNPGIATFMIMNNIEEHQRITNLQEETKDVFKDNKIVKLTYQMDAQQINCIKTC